MNTAITSITIPNTVTDIGSSCFMNTGITILIIPENVANISNEFFTSKTLVHEQREMDVTLVFLGKNTGVINEYNSYRSLEAVSMIYCLPGSVIQKYAREHHIPMKPLSEFNMEDYNV